jgi:uncharacterized protein (DUF488 family)
LPENGDSKRVRVLTIGHGRRESAELIALLGEVGVRTLVDVRRYPMSRRNPQFNRDAIAAVVQKAGIAYRHVQELGGLRIDEPGEERFACLRVEAFRSYAARMGTAGWQRALESVLAGSAPCLMCAETPWSRCHRRMIAELLTARDHEVVHVIRAGATEPHRLHKESEVRAGKLYVCGELVA